MKTRSLLLALALALAGAAMSSATADYPGQAGPSLLQVKSGQKSGGGADRAADKARQATGGRVLAAEPTERRGRPVYRVKLLTPSGQVRYIYVDTASGEIEE